LAYKTTKVNAHSFVKQAQLDFYFIYHVPGSLKFKKKFKLPGTWYSLRAYNAIKP